LAVWISNCITIGMIGVPSDVKRQPTSAPDKPILDESAFQQLLAAAHTLQEHNDRLQALPQVDQAQALAEVVETQKLIQTEQLNLPDTAALVAERARKITGASGSAVAILEGDHLSYRAGCGSAASEIGMRIPLASYFCVDGLREGHTVQSADVSQDPHVRGELCRERGIKALVVAPVYHNRKVSGVLELRFAEKRSFQEQDVRSCQLMAGLVTEVMVRMADAEWKQALAIERATMLEALERLKPQLDLLADQTPKPSAEPRKSLGKSEGASAPTTVNERLAKPSGQPDTCRGCGYQFEGPEFFCGICGTARAGKVESGDLQTKFAFLWQKQQPTDEKAEQKKERPQQAISAAAPAPPKLPGGLRRDDLRGNGSEDLHSNLQDIVELGGEDRHSDNEEVFPAALQEILSQYSAEATIAPEEVTPENTVAEPSPAPDVAKEKAPLPAELEEIIARFAAEDFSIEFEQHPAVEVPAQADAKPEIATAIEASVVPAEATLPVPVPPSYPWTSAAKARRWLESVSGQSPTKLFLMRHRANIYLGVASAILLAVLLGWGVRPVPSRPAASTRTASGSAKKNPPAPDLTLFEQILVSLGLAEAPEPPAYLGNPNIRVWVDLHTALYYCPGADLYGKTTAGKFTNQRDAQQDQFEPASRRPCD
jgi:hypothetical protein